MNYKKEELIKAYTSNLLALQVISEQLEELSKDIKSVEKNMSKIIPILKSI